MARKKKSENLENNSENSNVIDSSTTSSFAGKSDTGKAISDENSAGDKLFNNKNKTSKKVSKNANNIKVIFLGIGSYRYVQQHETSGLFYTFYENQYILMDKKQSAGSYKEMKFDTLKELEKYVKSKYYE